MTITTPSGHVVEIKDRITYGDQRAIQRVIQSGMLVNMDGGSRTMSAGVMLDAEEAALKLIVTAVTPNIGAKITDPEAILNTIYSWSPADGKAVFEAVNRVTQEAESPKVQS